MCPRLHPCKLVCYEDCSNCDELVELTLPCLHKFTLPCRTDEEKYNCQVEFNIVLPNCGHQGLRKCHQKPEDVACPIPCQEKLECGHTCPRRCHKKEKISDYPKVNFSLPIGLQGIFFFYFRISIYVYLKNTFDFPDTM